MGVINDVRTLVGGPLELNLSDFFFDSNGDALTYSASRTVKSLAIDSPNAPQDVIASTKAFETGLTITLAEMAGWDAETMLTIRASDPSGLWAEQTVAVRRNRKPDADEALTNRTGTDSIGTSGGQATEAIEIRSGLTGGGDTVEFRDDTRFDTLSISASSDDDTVASVAVKDSTVTITGIASGIADITVTATDEGELTAEQMFQVAVNGAPVVAKELADIVAPVGEKVVTVSGVAATGDDAYFSDPEKQALVITVESLDDGVAMCLAAEDNADANTAVIGSISVTRIPTLAGQDVVAACKVTATEPRDGPVTGAGNNLGQSVSQTFTVTFPAE
jgi:hypothetical protein